MEKKDTTIEGMRIIACVLVIWAHIQLDPVLDGVVRHGRLFWSAVIADNVPLFLLIMGFFLFHRVNGDEDIVPTAKYKIKSVFFRIYLPAVLVMAFSCYAFSFLSGESSLKQCIFGDYDRYWGWLWDFIFKLKAEGTGEHLWYVCTYVKMIIWFPVLALLCQNKKPRNEIRRFLIILSLMSILGTDIEFLLNRDLWDFSGIVFDCYFLYVLLGYELSLMFQKWSGNEKKIRCMGAICYVAGLFAKIMLQSFAYQLYGTEVQVRFVWLQCLPTYLTSCGLFVFMRSFCGTIRNRWICLMGKYTYYIFLFHRIVIYKTYLIGQKILSCNGNGQTFAGSLLYYLEYGAVVFGISLCFGIFFDILYGALLKAGGAGIQKIMAVYKRKGQGS